MYVVEIVVLFMLIFPFNFPTELYKPLAIGLLVSIVINDALELREEELNVKRTTLQKTKRHD